jgi:hypothetical protein
MLHVSAQVQADIGDCERRGRRDATVPGDEDLEVFQQLVGACASERDVSDLVVPICAAG